MEKFTKLGLSKELTDVLKKLGFEKPTEIQEKAIPLAMIGKDIIGGSATGSGKTLAFTSAIIENLKPNGEIQSLILTPTRELAEQVAISIRQFSKNKALNVLAVYGGVRIESQIRKLPVADILVGTPGRILDHLNRRTLRLDKIKFLVLDEVDRMFDMGFRKDVEKIIKECPEERQTMMFSATISQDIDYLAKKYTKNAKEISVKAYVDPSKLKQVYYDVPSREKFSLLVSLLRKEKADLVMVFCRTRRNVDFVAKNLILNEIDAKVIHGGLEQKKRIRVIEEFHRKGLGVLVCTDIAARGLDIKDVSHVYNYDIPSDLKDYIHRIGRTARAGKEGKAMNILSDRDYENFRNLTASKELNITPEKLPRIDFVQVKLEPKERDGRYKGYRNKSRRGNNNRFKGGNRGLRRSHGSHHRRSREGFRKHGKTADKDSSPRRSSGRSFNKRSDDRDNSKSSNRRPHNQSSNFRRPQQHRKPNTRKSPNRSGRHSRRY